MNTNIRLINRFFYTEDNAMVPAFMNEISEFTAKSNNVELVADKLMSMGDAKNNKQVTLAKMITPKNMTEDATVAYKHTNKYVEKYKSINTTFSLPGENDEATDDVYVAIAIPFNGNISEFIVEGNHAVVISAHCVMTPAIKFNENDKLLYGKICYVIIKINPTGGVFDNTIIKFTTVSSRWSEDRTSCSQTARNMIVTIPAQAITNVKDDEECFVVPTIESTNMFEAPLTADGKFVTPPIRFNNLFKIPVDKTVKNFSNDGGNYNKKSFYTKKRDNDIVTNFFSNDAYNEKPMSKKFKDAKKRYNDYDDE